MTSTSTENLIELINISQDIAQLNLGYLGISVAILGVLGGVFVYFNIRPLKDSLDKQENKIDSIKEQADMLLEESREVISNELGDFKEEQQVFLNSELKKQYDKIITKVNQSILKKEADIIEKTDKKSEDKDNKLKELLISTIKNDTTEIKNDLNSQLKELEKNIDRDIKNSVDDIKSLRKEIKDLKRTIIDFEIDRHEKKGQIGVISKTIEKLEMDIERGYGVEDDLLEIKKYIEKSGMPNFFFKQLTKTLEKCPDEFKNIKDDILKLAQDKMYKVAG